jgi:hypothetical protein
MWSDFNFVLEDRLVGGKNTAQRNSKMSLYSTFFWMKIWEEKRCVKLIGVLESAHVTRAFLERQ